MKILTKNYLLSLAIPLFIANLTTFGMDKSTMDTQTNQSKPKEIKYADLSINEFDMRYWPVRYLDPAKQAKLQFKNNSKSLGEPYIYINLNNQDTNTKSSEFIPLTMLLNSNDKTSIQIEYPNHIIHATCSRNTKIDDKSFEEQLKEYTQDFYSEPNYYGTNESIIKLEAANVVKPQSLKNKLIEQKEYRYELKEGCATVSPVEKRVCEHGKNGCSNDKQLEQIAFNNNNPEQKTKYQFFMDSQLGLKKTQRRLTSDQEPSKADQTAVYEFNKENVKSIVANDFDHAQICQKEYTKARQQRFHNNRE